MGNKSIANRAGIFYIKQPLALILPHKKVIIMYIDYICIHTNIQPEDDLGCFDGWFRESSIERWVYIYVWPPVTACPLRRLRPVRKATWTEVQRSRSRRFLPFKIYFNLASDGLDLMYTALHRRPKGYTDTRVGIDPARAKNVPCVTQGRHRTSRPGGQR